MNLLAALWQKFGNRSWIRVILLSALVGIVAGGGAYLFEYLLGEADSIFMIRGAGFQMPHAGAEAGAHAPTAPARPWLLLFLPAVGGLLTGWLVYTLAPEAEGHGTDAVIDSFHRHAGVIRTRVPIIKAIASAITIGSGGSAGREGPIGQIGAGFASMLAGWLKTGDQERRILVVAGAGAGIGAIFRAPLGGALFAVEVLYREMEFESAAIVPAFVASIVAYSLFCAGIGKWGPIFSVPALEFNDPWELPVYAGLGVLCAGVGIVYIKVFYGIRDRIFRKLPIHNHWKPALGGLAVGCLGFFMPSVLGMGYGWMQLAIDGRLTVAMMLGLAFAKIFATGLTISSGGSGGVFAPSIVIGGCLGAAVGTTAHNLFPGLPWHPAAFALIGMAGFFAGAAKTPVSVLIMVSEMTNGYGLLVPLMLTTATAYLLVPRRISIYEKQVNSRTDSPAHRGEFMADILEQITVREASPRRAPIVFHPETPLPDILEAVANSRQHTFPVVNAQDVLQGVILFDDIRLFFTDRNLPEGTICAQDLIATTLETISLDENLASVLTKFRLTLCDELPVVDPAGSRKMVGLLGRQDVSTTYQTRMQRYGKTT
jgi:CIC family chloride channel protein